MTDTMGSYAIAMGDYAIAMGDIYEALRTAKRKTDEALEIYTSELAKQAHDLSLRETEVYKRETALSKRDYAEIKAKKVEISGVGYVSYPKAAVDEINAVITSLIENVAAGHFFRGDIPWRLERVLKFLNSYKVNALEEVPGAKPKDSVKENTAWRHSLTFCDEITEDHYRYFSGKPKVEEAKPKDSGEGYITYRKEYVDYLMDVLGDFITRFENLNNPTWAEQLSHAVALLRKDSKVRVTDWEEYKFQWRNGRERLKSTKLQQTLRTEDGEESAKRCGRFQKLGDMGRPV